MSAEEPYSETLERINGIYRIVLGATVGFLPFVMFFFGAGCENRIATGRCILASNVLDNHCRNVVS